MFLPRPNKGFWAPVLAALALLSWIALAGARPGSWLFALAHRDDFRRSDIAIRAVEAYRRDHGHLPESLAAAGLPPEQFNESCPCYSKSSEQAYVVWFGWRLGESVIYDSASGQWRY